MDKIAVLIHQLDHDDEIERREAVVDLAENGEAVLPALAKALSDPRPRVRSGAAKVIGSLREGTKEIVSLLLGQLSDTVPDIRKWASHALALIEPPPVQELIPLLEQNDPDIVWRVAHVFAQIGRRADAARAPLARLLRSPDLSVRMNAATALGKIGVSNPEHFLTALNNAMRERNFEMAELLLIIGQDLPPTGALVAALVRVATRAPRASVVRRETISMVARLEPGIHFRETKTQINVNFSPGAVGSAEFFGEMLGSNQ